VVMNNSSSLAVRSCVVPSVKVPVAANCRGPKRSTFRARAPYLSLDIMSILQVAEWERLVAFF
jgi:hypothetical protein